MQTQLKVALVLGVVCVLACLLTLFSVPSDTAAAQPLEVIASGLDNPRGLTFGPEGALYVVEAGRGGDDPCTPFELFGEVACFGLTGVVTRIWGGQQERIVTGLGSMAHRSTGGFAFGPHASLFRAEVMPMSWSGDVVLNPVAAAES